MSESLFPLAGAKLVITVEDGYMKAYASPGDGAEILSYGVQGQVRDEVCDVVRFLVEQYLAANLAASVRAGRQHGDET